MSLYIYYTAIDCDNFEVGSFETFKNTRLMRKFFSNLDSELRVTNLVKLTKNEYQAALIEAPYFRDYNAESMGY